LLGQVALVRRKREEGRKDNRENASSSEKVDGGSGERQHTILAKMQRTLPQRVDISPTEAEYS